LVSARRLTVKDRDAAAIRRVERADARPCPGDRQRQNFDAHKAAKQIGSVLMRYSLTGMAVVMAMLADGSAVQETHPAEPDSTFTPPLTALKTEGTLLVVGGGKIPDAVRDKFLELAGGRKARLVVIPTASNLVDSGEVSSSSNDPSFVTPYSSHTSPLSLFHNSISSLTLTHNRLMDALLPKCPPSRFESYSGSWCKR
jgi:hypothetical protein